MRASAVVLALALGGGCRSSSTPAPALAPVPAAAPAAAPTPAAPTPAAPASAVPAPAAAAPTAAAGSKVVVAVTDEGFVPERIPAHRGQPLTLVITRRTDRTCAREIMFQGQAGKTPLPLGKTVEVTYTPKTSGEIRFGCAMGMMVSGVLAVVD